MRQKIQNNKSEGFTIIEVLIVLAIAGLIMLVVFMAVPALQRNSRNTQRKNDASSIASGLSEFISNNNGTLPTTAEASGTGTAIANSRRGFYTNTGMIFSANSGTPATAASPASATESATVVSPESITVWLGYSCNNNVVSNTGNTRAVSVQFAVETGGGQQIQCLQAQ